MGLLLQGIDEDTGKAAFQKNEWQPPQAMLGLGATSGVSLFRAMGGGLHYSFDGASDDELSMNLLLKNNGIAYDGSTISMTIFYQLSANANTTDDANLLLDLQFATIGDDTDANPTTIDESITLDGKVTGQVYSYMVPANFTGTALDELLMFSLMINAQGAGQGSYTGSIWMIGYELNKV